MDSGKAALAAGIRHIDTAQGYENEIATGETLTAAGIDKKDVFITSKISGVKFESMPASEVRQNIENSIKDLGFSPDLYLIHNPFVIEPYSDLPAAWKVLEDLKDEGKLKSIGVSNFRPQDLELILKDAKHKPVVNQVEFHPYVLAHLQPVLDIHKKHGIVTAAYGPLTPLLGHRHPTGGPIKPVLARIAQRINSEEAGKGLPSGFEVDEIAVLLLWTRDSGVITISASGNRDNIKRLGQIAGLPKGLLKSEEMAEIEKVGKGVHFRRYTEHMEQDFPVPNLPDGTQ